MENYLILNTLNFPILSALLILPVIGAIVAMFLRSETLLKYWALVVTLVTAFVSLPLWTHFDMSTAKYQFVELRHWFPALHLNYVVGVDGISVLLVLLTTLVMPLCVLCSWTYIKTRWKEFAIVTLLMETAMLGVFVCMNTVLFYIFWEGMLVPMYLIIAIWGGARKDYASIKFFVYTFAGSIFLLVAIIAMYIKTGTFFIPELMDYNFSFAFQMWVFVACALGFAIKMPMFPFHTWLPAAHVEAPVAGSVILASILLKMGGYGFLRFCLPMAPAATVYCMPYLLVMSLVSIIVGSYLALGQSDVKKLIAYSSVGHMGFVTLGIFLLNDAGIKGAMIQMLNHGVTTGALFILIGIIYERTHSREISDNSKLGMFMPIYVTFLGIFSLSSLAFPGTNSFIGEFLVLFGAFSKFPLVGAFAILGAILAAAYMLRLMQKMVWDDSNGHVPHGEQAEERKRKLFDCNSREFLQLAFLTIFVFWIGLHPQPLLNMMDTTVTHLMHQIDVGSVVPDAVHHGESQAMLENAGTWIKNLF